MKKIFIAVLAVVLLVSSLILIGNVSKKMKNTSNEYSSDMGFFDEERKYASDISFCFKMETEDTYAQEVEMRPGKGHKIYVSESNLSDDAEIVVTDEKGREMKRIILKKNENFSDLGENYDEGRYKIAITLPAECSGALEMKIDE